MEPTHLSRAPIVEALLDLRVQPTDGVTTDTVARLRDVVGAEYPEMKATYRVTQQLPQMDAPAPPGAVEVYGYTFSSADKRRILHVQPGGFTLSILKPYKDWDELRDEARARWEQYARLTRPTRVIRIGARSINRLEIPIPCDFKDWLLTYPEIGPSIPQGVTEMMTRVVIPLKRGVGIITQLIEAGVHTERVPLILDVDAFLEAEFTPTGGDLWAAIEGLREAKNLLFFGSITDRTGAMYK